MVVWIIWKDSSGIYIWMWWHLCISNNFTTSWKLKYSVWERSRIKSVIKAASSQACSENVFLCDLRPGVGSLNQGTFAFRYLLLTFHYGMNSYIVLPTAFLKIDILWWKIMPQVWFLFLKYYVVRSYLEKKITVIGLPPGTLSLYPKRSKSRRPCY